MNGAVFVAFTISVLPRVLVGFGSQAGAGQDRI